MAAADLRFAAWAQTALGRAVETTDGGGELGPARFRPGVTVTGPSSFQAQSPRFTLLGPGGVLGLDPRVLGRMDPPPDAIEVEDNYLASIELIVPELPWLLTPARAGDSNRLRPWIVLIVVGADTPFDAGRRPLPVLDAATDELPDLADSWGWAHVQLPSPDATPPAGLGALVGQTLARLVCPRRLAGGRTYRACVVPAFAGGVAAGLGRSAAETESHAPAWTLAGGQRVSLPVYHSWTFTTSVENVEFESLVTRLEPVKAAELTGFGALLVDVAEPWRNDDPLLHLAEPQTVAVQGALRPLDQPSDGTASAAALEDLAQRLTIQLEVPAERIADNGDPPGTTGAVAPPIYGGRHRNRDRVALENDGSPWIATMNLAAATRIAAGLGSEYVRANQEQLMTRAWEQVGAIREANQRRALAELATEVATSVHRRHVTTLAPGELVAMSAPAAHRTRMTAGGPTLTMEIAVSALPDAAASTSFARLLRPAGPVARATRTGLDSLVTVGLRGTVGLPDPKPVLARLRMSSQQAVAVTQLGTATESARRAIDATSAARQLVLRDAVADVAAAHGLQAAGTTVRNGLEAIADLDRAAVQHADVGALTAFVANRIASVAASMAGLADEQLAAAPDGRVVSVFGVQMQAGDLSDRIMSALAPGDRIARRLATRIGLPPRWHRPALEKVMACPVFPVPAALTLLATDPEWFLPGIGAFPANRVALLTSNDAFIESYIAGLNHEMMRELLWREYPTDLRGTPFQRFWPRPGGVPDIPPVHLWDRALGDNLIGGDEVLSVLLVRGDVVRRFPGLVVAAVPGLPAPAADDFATPQLDQRKWKPPLFSVRVDDSTAAYAFEVAPEQLRVELGPQTPGWFFAIQEHSYRIRFGFDRDKVDQTLTTWDDLHWGHVPTPNGFAVAGAPLTPAAPSQPDERNRRWGTDAADIARITLQKPFRVVVHANTLVEAS